MLKIMIILLLMSSQIVQAKDIIEGSGNIITGSRKINNFTKLTIDIPATIRIDNNVPLFFSIMADDNIIPLIDSSLENNHLIITTTKSFKTKNTIEIILGTKQLQQLNLESSMRVTLNNLQGNKLNIDTKGVSTLTANGSLTHLKINLSGSHKLNFQELKSQTVSLDTKGSNIVSINVQKNLDIKTKGISTIRYLGNPQSITKQVLGISNIKEIE